MKPKIIGLTGGIGSGKSTVAKLFETMGFPLYIADDQAKLLTNSPEILAQIVQTFGNEVIEDNQLNRAKLASLVFKNPTQLALLNAIVHPALQIHFQNWLLKYPSARYIIKEAAILFESGSYKDCDLIITVICPLETRIQRVIQRDHTTRTAVLERINNQWTDEQRIEKSNFIIENTDLSTLNQQVRDIIKQLK
ncbi:dephospho-CoA kinase [Flavobacterium branchiophilum]|uniref:Dephospho-CoA kinase n=1 Tax=Flavobacterium branchiophilum TaxID=55197 RepID=A0A543G8G6_9FLAO|nr:dephospho-CoA kinase [Flavobacterium branchiophilum]OXA68181.1 dephospho-CoA kinase [Flavobacterium branchiophilum] [Flavobacterium branchiophilum NBRC 15030 = ATCC 35035]TQM42378.1 dephospho-CoA kinase [Flavobacterium branchiophilum]GEM56631.1 dephospho-CoA kinase [Flavobacterium branchiophilum NBRC 15030 = ATCC 35035]